MGLAPIRSTARTGAAGQVWHRGQLRPIRRVLMLTHRVPYPPDRGDRIRSYHLLKQLAGHFQVSLASVSDEPVTPKQRQKQRHVLSELTEQLAIAEISPWPSRLRGSLGMLRGGAITPSMFYHRQLGQRIVQWHQEKPFDAVLTFCSGMIAYARLLTNGPNPPVRHVLDLVDVDSVKWASYARRTWGPMRWVYALEAKRLQRIESGRADAIDAITLVSDAEVETYRRSGGHHPNVHAINNGVNLDYFTAQPSGEDHAAAFVGVLNYKPNVDAVCWFARQVMPALRQRVEDATFVIAGRSPQAQVRALGRLPGVEVVGQVADVRPILRRAAVMVAPLRIAPGMQNKVLEAMACARAVVCSPGAARGIDAQVGRHLLVADTSGEYVDQLHKLLTIQTYRQRIGSAARRWVAYRYAWDNTMAPMSQLLAGTSKSTAAQAA